MSANEGSRDSSRTTVAFSCLGHLYIHLCTAFYFVIVLTLEHEFQRPYHELIELWTLGSLLVGVAALPAGMLSDRVGASKMMVVFFLGLGAASVAAGLIESTRGLMAALAGIGLFAAIYHPVGIPWLVRNTTTSRGKILGFNGVFGALGSALSGLVAGYLIDVSGWRAAFIVPGAVCFVTGLALLAFVGTGGVPERALPKVERESSSSAYSKRVFPILVVTMFLAGLIFHATQVSLPKLFEARNDGLVSEGALGVGVLVALVYGVAGVMQILGGHLADRLSLKWVYVAAVFGQAPMLWLASRTLGLPLVVVATLMVMSNASALPAENLLLAQHTPPHRHGLAFGLKFVLSFGAAPLAVALVSRVTSLTGELTPVYVLLSVAALVAFSLAVWIPNDPKPVPAA